MPKLGYGYALYPGSPSSLPSDISGLGLWLKADAGVKFGSYVKEITLTGAGSPTANGIYTREDAGTDGLGSFYFNNNSIYWSIEDSRWYLSDSEGAGSQSYSNFSPTLSDNWSVNDDLSPAPNATYKFFTPSQNNISVWEDQSQNKYNALPKYINPAFLNADLNGKPTIQLSSVGGYNKSLTILGNPMGEFGTTAFVVNYVQSEVFDGGDTNGALLGNFGGAENGSHWPYGLTNSVYDSFCSTIRKDDLGEPPGIRNWNTYCVISQDNNWKLFCNGLLYDNDPTNVYSNSIAGDGSLYIGMQNNAGTNQIFKGKIAEIIIYKKVLTETERQQVEGYLNAKYAIY